MLSVVITCFPSSAVVKNPPAKKRIHLPIQEAQEMQVRSLGWEDLLE